MLKHCCSSLSFQFHILLIVFFYQDEELMKLFILNKYSTLSIRDCCALIPSSINHSGGIRPFDHFNHITLNSQCCCINHSSFWGPCGDTVRCTRAYDTLCLQTCSTPLQPPSVLHSVMDQRTCALQATHVLPVPACWCDFTATALYSRWADAPTLCVNVWSGATCNDTWNPGGNDNCDPVLLRHWLLAEIISEIINKSFYAIWRNSGNSQTRQLQRRRWCHTYF